MQYKSNKITTNTGAPQEWVLSLVLFAIYTNKCQSKFPTVSTIKFADEMSVQGLTEVLQKMEKKPT